eukprot:s491_g18.t1
MPQVDYKSLLDDDQVTKPKGRKGRKAAPLIEEYPCDDHDVVQSAEPRRKRTRGPKPDATKDAPAQKKPRQQTPKAKAKAKTKSGSKQAKAKHSLLHDEQMVTTLMDFTKDFSADADHTSEVFKTFMRSQVSQPENYGLNIYWTSASCGVKDKGIGKDVNSFTFNSVPAPHVHRLAVAAFGLAGQGHSEKEDYAKHGPVIAKLKYNAKKALENLALTSNSV